MKAYSALSDFYDRLMTDFNYSEMVGFLLPELNVSKKSGLSLADGTGSASIALSAAGAKMTAVDLSSEMLTIAAEKAKAAGQNVTFLEGDINEFYPLKTYDFLVSMCDGLNYLHPANREDFFCAAYASLKRGGKFVFDVSSEYKLVKVLANNTFFDDEDDLAYIFTNTLDIKEEKVDMSVTLFDKEGELFRRYVDDSTQYIHKTDDLAAAARKAGFSVRVLDGATFGAPSDKSERLLFVLEKA